MAAVFLAYFVMFFNSWCIQVKVFLVPTLWLLSRKCSSSCSASGSGERDDLSRIGAKPLLPEWWSQIQIQDVWKLQVQKFGQINSNCRYIYISRINATSLVIMVDLPTRLSENPKGILLDRGKLARSCPKSLSDALLLWYATPTFSLFFWR